MAVYVAPDEEYRNYLLEERSAAEKKTKHQKRKTQTNNDKDNFNAPEWLRKTGYIKLGDCCCYYDTNREKLLVKAPYDISMQKVSKILTNVLPPEFFNKLSFGTQEKARTVIITDRIEDLYVYVGHAAIELMELDKNLPDQLEGENNAAAWEMLIKTIQNARNLGYLDEEKGEKNWSLMRPLIEACMKLQYYANPVIAYNIGKEFKKWEKNNPNGYIRQFLNMAENTPGFFDDIDEDENMKTVHSEQSQTISAEERLEKINEITAKNDKISKSILNDNAAAAMENDERNPFADITTETKEIKPAGTSRDKTPLEKIRNSVVGLRAIADKILDEETTGKTPEAETAEEIIDLVNKIEEEIPQNGNGKEKNAETFRNNAALMSFTTDLVAPPEAKFPPKSNRFVAWAKNKVLATMKNAPSVLLGAGIGYGVRYLGAQVGLKAGASIVTQFAANAITIVAPGVAAGIVAAPITATLLAAAVTGGVARAVTTAVLERKTQSKKEYAIKIGKSFVKGAAWSIAGFGIGAAIAEHVTAHAPTVVPANDPPQALITGNNELPHTLVPEQPPAIEETVATFESPENTASLDETTQTAAETTTEAAAPATQTVTTATIVPVEFQNDIAPEMYDKLSDSAKKLAERASRTGSAHLHNVFLKDAAKELWNAKDATLEMKEAATAMLQHGHDIAAEKGWNGAVSRMIDRDLSLCKKVLATLHR